MERPADTTIYRLIHRAMVASAERLAAVAGRGAGDPEAPGARWVNGFVAERPAGTRPRRTAWPSPPSWNGCRRPARSIERLALDHEELDGLLGRLEHEPARRRRARPRPAGGPHLRRGREHRPAASSATSATTSTRPSSWRPPGGCPTSWPGGRCRGCWRRARPTNEPAVRAVLGERLVRRSSGSRSHGSSSGPPSGRDGEVSSRAGASGRLRPWTSRARSPSSPAVPAASGSPPPSAWPPPAAGSCWPTSSRARSTGPPPSSGASTDVLGVVTDVADKASVDALADATYSRFGQADVVFGNAGVAVGGPIVEMSHDDWRWIIDVDLWGPVHGVEAFLPRMVEAGNGGHLLFTASFAGLVPNVGLGPYCVAKYGVVALAEVLHRELRPQQHRRERAVPDAGVDQHRQLRAQPAGRAGRARRLAARRRAGRGQPRHGRAGARRGGGGRSGGGAPSAPSGCTSCPTRRAGP